MDKANTFSKGILGVTMECAQCHDHKYDPFSQKDYFELYAFFNNTPDKGLQTTSSTQSRPAKHPLMWISDNEIDRSEEHTSELQSLMRISYAVFCLKKKKNCQKYKSNKPTPQ